MLDRELINTSGDIAEKTLKKVTVLCSHGNVRLKSCDLLLKDWIRLVSVFLSYIV
jgi:hypothetical protein